MNRYKRFVCVVVIIEIFLAVLCNSLYIYQNSGNNGKLYLVETNRVAMDIEKRNMTEDDIYTMDLSEYETIIGVSEFVADEICNNDYVVKEIDDKLYRIEYRAAKSGNILLVINGALLVMMLINGIVLFYVYQKLLKPFHAMSNLPYELAKGNLSTPVKEEKSRFFGRFLWGMDMLREKLEDNREKEMQFQKDRKTLILSLSHDIKTPLSSIDMYAKALLKNLYDTQDKKDEALRGITRNVKEIKKYIDDIIIASREDFLNMEVIQDEFYLSDIIKEVECYYRDKLSVLHTEFDVAKFSECLIKGDKNRLIEVLQNIMENAIKYGDGKSIRIYDEDEEDCKLIHILNSGCSLKEEELPNLFDSFYRGSNSHSVKGNGLGLYICKALMRKMDGEIFAHIKGGNFGVSVVLRKA